MMDVTKKFILKNKICEKIERAKFLKNIEIVTDRLHFKNHPDKWCKENCNPDKIETLDGQNTVICESFNFWLSG